jgi:hypothetical protein
MAAQGGDAGLHTSHLVNAARAEERRKALEDVNNQARDQSIIMVDRRRQASSVPHWAAMELTIRD